MELTSFRRFSLSRFLRFDLDFDFDLLLRERERDRDRLRELAKVARLT